MGFEATLTARELEQLAVLRVSAIAADPDEAKLLVRRTDLVALLAAVDRLVASPRVESLMVVQGPVSPGYLAASITVHQGRRGPR